MIFDIVPTSRFERSFKALIKRHRSLGKDILGFTDSLRSNPFQGDELSPGIRKIRMVIASKGSGKSGGARVITYTVITAETTGEVFLLDIYDKSDYSTVDISIIKSMVAELNLPT